MEMGMRGQVPVQIHLVDSAVTGEISEASAVTETVVIPHPNLPKARKTSIFGQLPTTSTAAIIKRLSTYFRAFSPVPPSGITTVPLPTPVSAIM